MALITASELRSWANPVMDTASDSELARVIGAATDWVGTVTGRVIEKIAITAKLSGAEADPYIDDPSYEVLRLAQAHRPVEYPASFAITEDGVSLTHTDGYSLSAGVLVADANADRRVKLIRLGVWSKGAPQNISVTYNAGYDTTTVPAAVKQLLYELAWLFYKSPSWLGSANVSGQGGSVSFEKELTPQAKMIIRALRAGGILS